MIVEIEPQDSKQVVVVHCSDIGLGKGKAIQHCDQNDQKMSKNQKLIFHDSLLTQDQFNINMQSNFSNKV